MVEPGDPFQGRELDIFESSAGPAAPNELRLEEADDRLGQGVVIRGSLAAHRGVDSSLGQALGVADGKVLPGFNWSSQRWFGWSAPIFSQAEALKLWDVVEIGLGGYVIGRSAEKVLPQIVEPMKKG
jgi:hypothetical protein